LSSLFNESLILPLIPRDFVACMQSVIKELRRESEVIVVTLTMFSHSKRIILYSRDANLRQSIFGFYLVHIVDLDLQLLTHAQIHSSKMV
jgi:hypothetical protein